MTNSALASATADNAPLIRLRGVTKTYPGATAPFTALDDLSLDIRAGEFVAVTGESGSGKSTLLSLVAGIDRATRGEVRVGATAVHSLPEARMAEWRGAAVGIVFQFFQLIPTLSAAENVMLPMDFCDRWPARERRDRALALLERVGVADQADKLPSRLSGGQQQRVAIARALANDPPLLLADEPTGNLDSRTSESVLSLFGEIVSSGRTLLLVTHAPAALRHASRTVALADGRLVSDSRA
ncbi:MAG: ABC transporter ATP-binding protein [Gemmatimonadetes bacterium]|nr:ABC transporter ATP-binding protein [Gemmatimonadota bacterium]